MFHAGIMNSQVLNRADFIQLPKPSLSLYPSKTLLLRFPYFSATFHRKRRRFGANSLKLGNVRACRASSSNSVEVSANSEGDAESAQIFEVLFIYLFIIWIIDDVW